MCQALRRAVSYIISLNDNPTVYGLLPILQKKTTDVQEVKQFLKATQ